MNSKRLIYVTKICKYVVVFVCLFVCLFVFLFLFLFFVVVFFIFCGVRWDGGVGFSFHRKEVFCMKCQVLCSWENTKHINDSLSANVIISERRVKRFLLFLLSEAYLHCKP